MYVFYVLYWNVVVSCVLLHVMYIRIYVQDEFVDHYSPKVFELIGGLRSCISLAANRWVTFEPCLTLAKDKLDF